MRLPFLPRQSKQPVGRKVYRLPRTTRRPAENPYFNRRVQRRVVRIVPVVAAAAAPVALLTSAILGLTLPGLQIGQVSVTGHDRVTREEIDRALHDEYQSRFLGVFSRRNYFLFRTEAVRAALAAHPLVSGVDVSKAFPDRLNVRIEEREAAYQVLSTDWRVLADEVGVAFDVREGEGAGRPPPEPRPATASGTPLLAPTTTWKLPELVNIVQERVTSSYPTLYDTSELDAVLGEEIVPATTRDAVQRVRALLEEFPGGLTTIGAIYDRSRRHELQIITSEGWRILMDAGLSLEAPLDALRAVLQEQIKDRSTLEYVDVRYQDRVYYK